MQVGRSEILKIPLILKILILTNTRARTTKRETYPCKPIKGEGIVARDSRLVSVACPCKQAPSSPVIPAKVGIQTISAKPAIRNQVQIPISGSLLPLWAYRGRFGFSSFWRYRNLGGRGERRTKSVIRNQVQIAVSGSLLPLREKARMRVSRALARVLTLEPTPVSPLWEKARMRVRRALARLCGLDARAPGDANLPL